MIIKTAYGYTVEKEGQYLDIAFFDEDVVRFVYSKERQVPLGSGTIVQSPVALELKLEGNRIETEKLIIEIDEQNLRTKIFDKQGQLLSQDQEILIRKKPADKKHSGQWTLDDRIDLAAETYRGKDESRVKVIKKILWEEGFYGLGEKYSYLNHMGSKTQNWCTDVLAQAPLHHPLMRQYHTSIPFYIGANKALAYGIFWDTTYKNTFDFGKYNPQRVEMSADGGIIDYYFIYGPKIEQVVEKYTRLIGRMPLPDKKYLGYQQCRWSYKDSQEVIAVAERMRAEQIPCDVIYLDIDYMEAYKVFTYDTERFGDFKAMVDRLKALDFKLVVIIDPGVKREEGYAIYDEGMAKDYFVKDKNGKVYVGSVWPGDSVFPDFLRTEVRDWWGQCHDRLFELGVDGIWNDMNEPADASTESKTLPENALHRDDQGHKHLHEEIHNIYGKLEAEATYKAMIQRGIERPFILTRAAAAGSQRYAALWTGDNASIWEHLEASIPMFLNLGLSGYPWIGGDVGGFAADTTPELLLRWTQLGAFMPFFRNHSSLGTLNQEPWAFDEETKDLVKEAILWRYRWMEHLYQLFYRAHSQGRPVLAPLFYYYQEDPETYGVHDGFFFGDNMLVYPVVRPQVTQRMVYLPEGDWYDYWTNEKYTGKQWLVVPVSADKIPLFVKSASFIVELEPESTVNYQPKALVIKHYGTEDFVGELYFDDGQTAQYQKGKSSLLEIGRKNGQSYSKIIQDNFEIPSLIWKNIR